MNEKDKQIIKAFIEKNWDSNWADSRTEEGDAEWLGKFLEFYKKRIGLSAKDFLRKFAKEMEKDENV